MTASSLGEMAKQMALARQEPHLFCDLLLAYEDHKVVPHPLHDLMHRAVAVCAETQRHLLLIAPPEHGKTQQVMKWLLWRLGKWPAQRVALVSADQDLSRKNLLSIRRSLESKLYGEIFPEVVRGLGGEWSRERLFMEGQHYPAFEAFGLDFIAEGLRADVVWLDDAVARKCQRSEMERERARSAIFGTWLSRVTKGGFCIFTNNVWHRSDPIHEMASSSSFTTLWIGYVSTDKIWWRIDNAPAGWEGETGGELDLWAIWPKARLESRRYEDRATYRRLWGGRAMTEEDSRFPPPGKWGAYDELPPAKELKFYAYFDPSGGKTIKKLDYAAIIVLAVNAKGTVFVADCWVERASPQTQIGQCWNFHRDLLKDGGPGLEQLEIELAPRDEAWIRETIELHQETLRERGDLSWRLDWTIRHPWENKNSRIERLEPWLRNGWLLWPRETLKPSTAPALEYWRRLVGQLEDVPFGDHDDGPDALAGAVVLVKHLRPNLNLSEEKTDTPDPSVLAEKAKRWDPMTGKPKRMSMSMAWRL